MTQTISQITIKTKVEDLFKKKKSYKLVAHNDDTTPMQLVVAIFVGIIGLDEPEAANKTLEVHNEGSAILMTGKKSKLQALADRAMEVAQHYGAVEFTLTVEEE